MNTNFLSPTAGRPWTFRTAITIARRATTLTTLVALCALCPIIGCETMRDVKQTVRDSVVDSVEAVDAATTSKPLSREVDLIKKEPDIRVRVARASHEQHLSGPKHFVARPATGSRSPNALALKPRALIGPITISSSDRGVRVTDAAKSTTDFGFGVDIEVLASDGTINGATELPGESIHMDGRPFPGYLTIRPKWTDAPANFDITVTMPIESYIPGVLSRELYKDWPRQSFEAQAVCARTYALQERGRARADSKVVDVEDSTSDQVFGGTASLTVAAEAARATRGWVLTENGSLIRAYFSSQCGGRSASAADAWSTRTAPVFNRAKALQGRPRTHYCQRSPLYRWSVTRSGDDLSKRLRAWGKSKGVELADLTRVRSIHPKDFNDAGRPNSYTITTESAREYSIAAEELRDACNFAVPGLAPITKENRLNSGDVDVAVFGSQVRLSGRGYGHGVGLCQWCAKGMAQAGLDWRSMVDQFYPGVEVKKLY